MASAGSSAPHPRRRSPVWMVYAATAGLLAFAVFALWRSVAEAPSRQLSGELPGVGTITVTLGMTPDPPRIGNIPITLRVTGAGGAHVIADVAAVRVAPGGKERIVLEHGADGTYRGTVAFPDVGEWALEVEITEGGATATLRFPIRVTGNI